MLKTKTHFEQVPIEIVRKIVEEQIRRAEAIGVTPIAKGETCPNQPPRSTN